MPINKYKVEIFHESPNKKELLKTINIWVELESNRDPHEFVYARTRLIKE